MLSRSDANVDVAIDKVVLRHIRVAPQLVLESDEDVLWIVPRHLNSSSILNLQQNALLYVFVLVVEQRRRAKKGTYDKTIIRS